METHTINQSEKSERGKGRRSSKIPKLCYKINPNKSTSIHPRSRYQQTRKIERTKIFEEISRFPRASVGSREHGCASLLVPLPFSPPTDCDCRVSYSSDKIFVQPGA